MPSSVAGSTVVKPVPSPGGCYGIQVLVAGHQKRWRDEVAGQVRRAGYQATACDSAIDALTVLVLGLPVDVLVADVSLRGALCCSRLAVEARALRPGLRIVLASDVSDDSARDAAGVPQDAILVPYDLRGSGVADTVREILADRTTGAAA